MARFDESIEVNANVTEAYNLFSQFERFPGFMEGVQEVRRTGPDTLHWRAEIGGREEEWDAKVTEEVPDTRIAWQSVSGSRNFGEVTFEKLDEGTTEVHLHIEYEPEGFIENVGTLLGVVNARMKGDLLRFKELLESGGHEAGWHDPADRSRAAADRDRAIGEAQRSVHRDDYPAGSNAGAVAGGALGGAGGAFERNVDRAGDALDRGVDNVSDMANRGADNLGDAASRGAQNASDMANRGVDNLGDAAGRGADNVSDMANRGIDDISDMAHRGSDRVTDLTDRVDNRLERGRSDPADAADDLDLDRDADVDPLSDRARRDRRDV